MLYIADIFIPELYKSVKYLWGGYIPDEYYETADIVVKSTDSDYRGTFKASDIGDNVLGKTTVGVVSLNNLDLKLLDIIKSSKQIKSSRRGNVFLFDIHNFDDYYFLFYGSSSILTLGDIIDKEFRNCYIQGNKLDVSISKDLTCRYIINTKGSKFLAKIVTLYKRN